MTIYGRGLVKALGIEHEAAPPADASTASLAGLAPHAATLSHWTLAPTFHRDTLAYAFNARHRTFLPVATLAFVGQTVFWKQGSLMATSGISPQLTLKDGENGIEITVISADKTAVRQYALRVTLTE